MFSLREREKTIKNDPLQVSQLEVEKFLGLKRICSAQLVEWQRLMFIITGTVTLAVAQTGTASPLMKVKTHLEDLRWAALVWLELIFHLI